MMTSLRLLIFGVCVLGAVSSARSAETVEEFVQETSARELKAFFKTLRLDQPALVSIQNAVAQEDWTTACKALADYYRKRFPELQLKLLRKGTARTSEGEALLQGTFTIQGATFTQPRRTDGGLNWKHRGRRGDAEWAWMLNRHLYFMDLLSAWKATGNPRYAKGFDRDLQDWIQANPFSWFNQTAWRPMEAGRRLSDVWPWVFYGFQQSEGFSDAGRLMMLKSVFEQAEFLRKHHAAHGNHLNAEMVGLASAAVYWPEFKQSRVWLNKAVETMRRELTERIYPDGTQQELSNHYQIIVARHADRMTQLLAIANHPAQSEFRQIANQLWNYVYLTTKPDGGGLLNNDGDWEDNTRWLATASALRGWDAWIEQTKQTAQKGSRGSVFFPWAGQAILRDAPMGTAQDWLFFDAGPLGLAHQHYDKLHISLHSNGRDVLVDTGRYTYQPNKWRKYFTGVRGHNVVSVEGCTSLEEPRVAKKPTEATFISQPQADFVLGEARFLPSSLLSFERPRHRRAVLSVRGEYWLVLDEVVSFQKRKLETFWHFHPDSSLVKRGDVFQEIRSGIYITPIGFQNADFQIVKGQEKPVVQGWWSPRYNEKKPALTAIFSEQTAKPTLRGWLFSKQPVRVVSWQSQNGKVDLRLNLEGREDVLEVNMTTETCSLRLGKGSALDPR